MSYHNPRQLEIFGPEVPFRPVYSYTPNPNRVRNRLHRMLDQAKAAEVCPWDTANFALYRVIFPQMANWLSDSEAARLRGTFLDHIARFVVIERRALRSTGRSLVPVES